jgi:7,8-dihydropterin-6-yl-methyl-4-(beta-D-ribofuranosyl)aminobenzene 5'-phosphate synthase
MTSLDPVDQLEFHVLIDNVTDSLSTAPSNVTLEWSALMRAGMRQMSGKCQCCANHGLALVVTATRGAVKHTVLFKIPTTRAEIVHSGTPALRSPST